MHVLLFRTLGSKPIAPVLQIYPISAALPITIPVQIAILRKQHDLNQSPAQPLACPPRCNILGIAHNPDRSESMSLCKRKKKPAGSLCIVMPAILRLHPIPNMSEIRCYIVSVADAYINPASPTPANPHLKRISRKPLSIRITRRCIKKNKLKLRIFERARVDETKLAIIDFHCLSIMLGRLGRQYSALYELGSVNWVVISESPPHSLKGFRNPYLIFIFYHRRRLAKGKAP